MVSPSAVSVCCLLSLLKHYSLGVRKHFIFVFVFVLDQRDLMMRKSGALK